MLLMFEKGIRRWISMISHSMEKSITSMADKYDDTEPQRIYPI